MFRIPNPPPDNIFAIDLSPLKSFLVDLPPRATVGMRRAMPGWEAVQLEIDNNQPKYGDRAGITKSDFDRFVTLNDQYGQIQQRLPVVAKAVEVLTESLAHIDHQRHGLSTQFADSVESHADTEGRDPTLLTAYQKTIDYRSVIADKSVKTRKKNAEAQSQPDKPAEAEPEAGTGEPAETGAPAGPTDDAQGTGKPGEIISRIPNPPPDNIFTIDLNPLKAFLVDLPPGATKGMRKEQQGWLDVCEEIVTNQPSYGDRAGITKTDFDRFVALNEQYAQILMVLPLLEKAKEILTESLAQTDNVRHKLATQFANSAEAHAKSEGGDPTLRTAYEQTIAYRSRR